MIRRIRTKEGSFLPGRPSFQIGYFFLSLLFFVLLTSPAYADTLILHPSGKSASPASVGAWNLPAGGSYATVFDNNDGDTTSIQDSTVNDKIYLDIDDTSLVGWTINSVQVFAIARANGSSTAIQVGLRSGASDSDHLGSSRSVRSSSYRSYAGALHAVNPRTNAAWTWSDINSLIGVVVHTSSSSALIVTELFVNVNYSKTLLPNGKNGLTTGWSYTPAGSEATALDSNDSDSTYASSTAVNDKLYIDMDDFPVATTTLITGVQLNVIARCVTVPCNLAVGVRTNGADFVKSFDAVSGAGTIYATSSARTAIHGLATSFTTQLGVGSQITALGQIVSVTAISDDNDITVSPAFDTTFPTNPDFAVPFTFLGGTTVYQRFTSDFFPKNPATGTQWSWNDINSLMGVVQHVTNANGLRVTQAYLSINYINPVVLSYSPDDGYGSSDGLYPKSGGINDPFTYKIVYTNLNGNAPTTIQVHIDNDGGHEMTRDLNAEDPDYSDLDYTNGEQYTYTASSLPQGSHTYYFTASDGFDSTRNPSTTLLNGPGVAIPAGTKDIFPSGENGLTIGDWSFNGAPASSALDDNNGNTSYVDDASNDRGATLYLDMDDPGLTGPSISSVQVSAMMCSPGSAATIRLGLRLNGTDYVSTTQNAPVSSGCASYGNVTPSSVSFSTNPDTGKAWTWQDINDMIGIIVNESNNPVQVTLFKVSVTHSPVGLSFPSDEPGYGNNGVNPDTGNSATPFIYKVVYTNANGTAPAAGYPKLYIDGNAAVTMTKDLSPADPSLADNDYVDGEQYTYSKPAGFASGTHTYYFEASSSDSGGVVRFPGGTATHKGPAISLPAGSLRLFPSDVADGTNGWSFCTGFRSSDCFDPTTALDDDMTTPNHDGDGSYARSRNADDFLYMSLDDPQYNGQFITSVQVKAVLRDEGTAASFTLGLYSVAQLVESAVLTTTPANTYATYSGIVYGVNPMTNLPWTWSDLQSLIAVIHHTDSDRLRVTQLYVVVTYGPVQLQTSPETGYIVDGVSPEIGNTATPFKFKTVYYHVNNVAPSAPPKVHIDGNATGVAMSVDTNAVPVAGSGTISSSSITVTGNGTNFLSEMVVGGTITALGQTKTVTAITSATVLTVNSAFSSNLPSGTSYTHNGLNDGNYANGEQYSYTATLAQGTHTYYFDVSDGTNSARLPAGTGTTYRGPDVALPSGTIPTLSPSGKSPSKATTGWTFCTGATPTCSANGSGSYADTAALDTNDGDTSYARSTVSGDQLYMDLDDPGSFSSGLSIASIQVVAFARTTSSTLFDLGLHLGDTDYLSGQSKSPSTSYGEFDGLVYTTNPETGENWNWNDVKNLTLAVVHQAANELRVTQLYLKVTYSPIQLTFSPDPRYFDDGVDPNGATTTSTFTYRIVYTQAYGIAPASGYPKVHIDGNAAGAQMFLDTDPNVPAYLRDNDFTNGEQYVYSTTLGAQGTPHNYYFDVSDGTSTARIPLTGALSGPVVSGSAPTLSFANTNTATQPGYALRAAGTGTLTTTGTTAVTGSGTAQFLSQLQVGTTITAAGGQTRTVTAINSNTSLTVDTPFSPNLSTASFTYAAWSGTGTLTTTGTTAVAGSGTAQFLSQLQVGSTLTAAGQTRTVTSISSNTALTVDSPFSPNLSGAAFTYFTDPALRGVEPNKGTVSTPFVFKIVYTDGDNNPPVAGYPRLLLDYNTTIYGMTPDTGVTTPGAGTISSSSTTVTGNGTNFLIELVVGDTITASGQTKTITGITSATILTVNSAFSANLPSGTSYTHNGLSDGNYINGEQYTVSVTIPDPGTHAYSFDATDGVTPVLWPLNGDDFLAPSVVDSNSPSVVIYPASRNAQTSGFTFQGSNQDPATALDTNDGDTSYARGTRQTDQLYMNMDDTARGASTIQSVQLFAVVRDTGSNSIQFAVGTQIGGTDYTTLYTTPGTGAYATYAGPLHGATNPKTGAPWTWNDITNLLGTVKIVQDNCSRNGCREIRVTQMYVRVNYTNLSNLSYSPEAGYFGTDGVDPDGWNQAHIYTYKVVYANGANIAPTSLQVVIDNDGGHDMFHDGSFITNDPLRNGDYTDGEQFYYSTAAGQLAVGPHQYYFRASDGTNSYRLPATGYLNGPNVSTAEPTLTFSSETGFVTDGVNPDSGESASQPFTYKVIYTHPNNNYPLYVKVHIDDVEHLMVPDTAAANATLRDCATNTTSCYTNGEQYSFTTTLPLGSHTYLFEATDGAKQVFLPLVPPAVFSGPAVSDSSPPSAITDLAISARGTTSTTLTWTAPGNASTGPGCPCGTVVSYNIRYSTLKIVDDSATPGVGEIRFSNATAVTNPPVPRPAGSIETVTISGLNSNTPYYFAMKSADEVPAHVPPLSNVVNGTSVPPIPSTNLLSSWNMVSVPLQALDVATVFGSSVGFPITLNKWNSTGLTGSSGSFDLLSSSDLIQPGVGYFLESPDDARYLHPSGGSAVTAATVEIPLQQGWNLIGNPYTKDILLSTTCISRNGATGTCPSSATSGNYMSFANALQQPGWGITNSLYSWDGSTYSVQTTNDPDVTRRATLRAWQGYWLWINDSVNTYKLIIVKP